jgi:dCMP deaminase
MDTETAAIFKEAGVKLRRFSPPRHGLINLGGENPGIDAETEIGETALVTRNGPTP